MATRQLLKNLEKPRIFSYQWVMTTLSIYRIALSPYQNRDFHLWEKDRLESIADGISYNFQSDLKELAQDSVVITNTNINTDFLMDLDQSKLKLVLHPNSGYDNFSTELVEKLNCPIIPGNSIRAQGVTQYILSCLCSHFSTANFVQYWDNNRQWNRTLLSDLKVAILGYGHIGKLLEKSLKPIVGELTIYDPYCGKEKLDIEGAHVIIPVPSLNKSSHHLVDAAFLEKISPTAVIINASRGKIIAENDLILWLVENPKSFAYLDVFENEPHDFMSFRGLNNIKLSSHIAGVSKNLDQKILDFEEAMIRKFLKGESFSETLNNKIMKGI